MSDATQLPRVLNPTTDVARHTSALRQRGEHGTRATAWLRELDASGLLGRGGAGVATARKVHLLRDQRSHHKTVVVNAMEGEPASHKDFALLHANAQLVFDGAVMLATMIGASDVVVCVARDRSALVEHVTQALAQRRTRDLREPTFTLRTPPGRYVAGEESALTHWLNDNESLPQYRARRPHVLHLGRSALLIDNAETCAHVGLIGHHGASWFRALGTANSPGTTLVSLSGAIDRPKVMELALGTPLRALLHAAGADESPQALLLGGYGGTWLSAEHLDLDYDHESLGSVGATLGAGVIVVVPQGVCGLRETWRIVSWMANESARQCGPCAFGLPAMADDLAQLMNASGDTTRAHARLRERADHVEGRGACRHPDGVVRLVRSALHVFAEDLEHHLSVGPCAGARERRSVTIVPNLEHEADLQWV